MDEESTKPVKRATRARKTAASATSDYSLTASESPKPSKHLLAFEGLFDDVATHIASAKDEFVRLQKEIEEQKENWEKEKKAHEAFVLERNQQEEIGRKREQEAYDYEITKKRRQEEDAFLEKKSKWEKELALQKEVIEAERKELTELRKDVAGFEAETEKAVKEATTSLQRGLTEEFASEKKFSEQEFKAEKELMGLRISTITQENARQSKEIEALKKALEEATAQLKDVAVRVIESGSNAAKPQFPQDQKSPNP